MIAASCVLLTACASGGSVNDSEVNVRQVTQSAQCGLTGPGIAYVLNESERESLLDLNGQNMVTRAVRDVNLTRESIVIVTLGQKPTAGYSVGLANASADGETLTLSVQVSSPPADAMTAQVITSPCVVLAVPADNWQQIRVLGLTEQPLVKRLGD
ncbi:MAG: protease complex subunit PrcB family protein [Pseudomonadota bacterium]|nr:protease complex subunit PrcB family protein [Pseudomonadota bacterium]